MVYSLLSMLGTHDKDDMSRTLLAMSSSQDSCIAMRQSGCLPLLIQLLHGNDKDSLLLGNTHTHTHTAFPPFTLKTCVHLATQVTHGEVRRHEHEHRLRCTTSSIVSLMTKGGAERSESCTCWSRSAITARHAGAGRRTTRGGWTRRTTPVSD